jgi:hypothetical protein
MVLDELLSGRLVETAPLPLQFIARIGDLRPRFLAKCRVGRGHRSIARNGRVLLASDCALEELAGAAAQVRLQVWHRQILPGDRAEPYGYLLSIRRSGPGLPNAVFWDLRLVALPAAQPHLLLDVGGRRWLQLVSGEW